MRLAAQSRLAGMALKRSGRVFANPRGRPGRSWATELQWVLAWTCRAAGQAGVTVLLPEVAAMTIKP